MTELDYYGHSRPEMLAFLPGKVERLLDIGCGAGATTHAIRQLHPLVWAGGVEFVAAQAERVRPGTFERLWVIDAEKITFETEIEPASLDAILCFDVLEHMVDPWAFVKRVSPLLKPGGRLVISIPNIRNWKFIRALLFKGDFHYKDAGLLDRTHLRFFVSDTAAELATCGGLRLVSVANVKPWPLSHSKGLLSRLTFGKLDDLMIKQFAVVAEAGKGI